MAALAGAWDAIRARHVEVSPVILAVGPGSSYPSGRVILGHFRSMGWVPERNGDTDIELRTAVRAVNDALESGDVEALTARLGWSAEATLRSAIELSNELRATVSEVFITDECLARGSTTVMATLLHEAVHGVAKQRGVSETSWRGRYHNQRFKAIAEEFGLQVSSDPPYGSSVTAAPHATTAVYAAAVDALEGALRAREPRPPAPTGITSLRCGCGRLVRTARRGSVACEVVCGACRVEAQSR